MFSYNVSKLEDKLGVGSDTFCGVDQFHFVLTEKTDTYIEIYFEKLVRYSPRRTWITQYSG